jgi:prolipoprotein diacylglyceryltransferase
MFGSTRFLLEFARDNEKLFWGISNLAIQAFIMLVVGIMLFCVIKSINKQTDGVQQAHR